MYAIPITITYIVAILANFFVSIFSNFVYLSIIYRIAKIVTTYKIIIRILLRLYSAYSL